MRTHKKRRIFIVITMSLVLVLLFLYNLDSIYVETKIMAQFPEKIVGFTKKKKQTDFVYTLLCTNEQFLDFIQEIEQKGFKKNHGLTIIYSKNLSILCDPTIDDLYIGNRNRIYTPAIIHKKNESKLYLIIADGMM